MVITCSFPLVLEVGALCPENYKCMLLQVLYEDGDVEILNLEAEKWKLVEGDSGDKVGTTGFNNINLITSMLLFLMDN